MKKTKSSLMIGLLAVTAGALSSCGGKQADLVFWSSFGSSYTSVLTSIAKQAGNSIGKSIEHISQGSYDKVKEEMMSAIADASYPDLVTGYPDHFAEYIGNDILVTLDDFVKNYDAEHGTNLLDDYLPAYMDENYDLNVDAEGNKVLSALPFNKSTELMGYNGVFVDYCASVDADLAVVPATWQEWTVKGPKYREIYDTLCGTGNKDGKVLSGNQDYEGTASNFVVYNSLAEAQADSSRKVLLNFTDVDKEVTRIISWDSTDNMFITLVRQWGAQYTRLTTEQKKIQPLYRKGDIMFYSSENKPKVIECMKFFNKLNKQHIFGVPKELDGSYSSKAFENNNVMFMLCSSGGLSYNTAKWENRFRVAPLPYNADLGNEGKYVISQGADITLTDRSNADLQRKAFDAMVEMTTGRLQAEWCLQTGYYPCSKSATNDPQYQKFLNEATPEGIQAYMEETGCSEQEAKEHAYETPTRVAYREGSNVNESEYMIAEKGWHKFVDPAFIGSSNIRTLVKTVFESVFIKILAADINNDAAYDAVLKGIVTDPTIKQKAQNINVVY